MTKRVSRSTVATEVTAAIEVMAVGMAKANRAARARRNVASDERLSRTRRRRTTKQRNPKAAIKAIQPSAADAAVVVADVEHLERSQVRQKRRLRLRKIGNEL
jgi:thiamine pyrophosphate-dependent acetolactate synthase large subunit-like protein